MKCTAFIASSSEGLKLARELRHALQGRVTCTIWDQGVFEPSHYPLPDLVKSFGEHDFGLFVLSADDVVIMRGTEREAVRDNVILEMGLSFGKLGIERSLLVQAAEIGDLLLPSDLNGLTKVILATTDSAIDEAANKIAEIARKRGPKGVLFEDRFIGDVDSKWEFQGNSWRYPEPGILVVSAGKVGDESIGITKIGHHWVNYLVEFEARIDQDCLGVVVRAQDLNNCYMLQIRSDVVRPHRRDPAFLLTVPTSPLGLETRLGMRQGGTWSTHYSPADLQKPLTDWFCVRLAVEYKAVRLWINEEIVLERPDFLDHMSGRFGFRNASFEKASVRNLVIRETR